jgi:heme-degrading monooxygenase HmoA
MPGFIAYDDFQGSDGSAIAIARFTTRAAMRAWVRQPDHLEVQRMVGDLYESMWVQTAETFSEAVLDQGRRRDGDLAHLFVG